jgi:raffinose/stachyose/melibiose transport system permease protein
MTRTKIWKRFAFGLGAFLSLVYAFPFFLVVVNSFKPKREILENTLALPIEFSFENFEIAMEKMNYFQALTNSIVVTVGSVAAIIVTSSMLAYYLARRQNKFSKITFLVLVASMIVPFQSLMIPFVGIYRVGATSNELGELVGSDIADRWFPIAALMFFYIGFGVAMSTFLYHGFISNIPYELDEAAMLDGASHFTVFRRIIFPMLTPVTATVAIINALWVWNDFLLPSLILWEDAKTLPLSTYHFYGMYTANYGQAMAGLLLAVLPIVVFYFILQRKIISGISAGAVK